MPRPTDPEPLTPDWDFRLGPRADDGLVLDSDAPLTPAQAAERLSLRSLAYTAGSSSFKASAASPAGRSAYVPPVARWTSTLRRKDEVRASLWTTASSPFPHIAGQLISAGAALYQRCRSCR
ncbi:DUF5954 family protein (plasmid) [Streptomyces sp. NBC_00708]